LNKIESISENLLKN